MNWLNQTINTYTKSPVESTLTGELIDTLSSATVIKGRVRPLSMGERYMRNKEYSDITHRMYSTYDVNADVVIWLNIEYDIVSKIDPMSFGRFYQYDLKAVV